MAFSSVHEMVELCKSTSKPLFELILESDLAESGLTRAESEAEMHRLWAVMRATRDGYCGADRSMSGFAGGDAAKVNAAAARGVLYADGYFADVMAEALKTAECNACMKRIVAAPTAGSCGVLPAGLLPLFRAGRADVVIAGGTEATIAEFAVGGFMKMKALATQFNDAPEKASRPFNADRCGFVMGEGAAVLILESEEHAKARGARVYCELAGYGATSDAYHITAPDPSGAGAVKAIRLALKDAAVDDLSTVDYINAHGTSTHLNDVMETKAFKEVFGDEQAHKIKISSTKSMTGHLLGATGALEAAFCALAIADSFVPPTINYENPDPECDLDYTPNTGVAKDIRVAVSTSLGFGGHNGVLVFKKH